MHGNAGRRIAGFGRQEDVRSQGGAWISGSRQVRRACGLNREPNLNAGAWQSFVESGGISRLRNYFRVIALDGGGRGGGRIEINGVVASGNRESEALGGFVKDDDIVGISGGRNHFNVEEVLLGDLGEVVMGCGNSKRLGKLCAGITGDEANCIGVKGDIGRGGSGSGSIRHKPQLDFLDGRCRETQMHRHIVRRSRGAGRLDRCPFHSDEACGYSGGVIVVVDGQREDVRACGRADGAPCTREGTTLA